MFEVYNTHGEQFAFHRALDSEEFGLQFMGVNTNMSEFEESFAMSPGMWFLIPLGIAHSVKDCGPDFRRRKAGPPARPAAESQNFWLAS